MNRWISLSFAALLAVVAAAGRAPAQTAETGHGEERFNTRLVGVHDLQARSAYQPLPVRQGERRIAYVGHHAGERLNPLTGAVEPNVMSDRAPLTPKDESSSETDRGSHNNGGGGTSGRLFQWRVFIPEAKLTRPVRHRAPNCTRPPGCGRAAKRTVPVQGASSESDRPVPPPPTPRKLEASR